MNPKRVGIIGFDQVTALHVIAPAEAFRAAALDNGYGGRIPCYEVCIIGVGSEKFHTDSGLEVQAQTTLDKVEELDTIIVAGGPGIREPKVSQAIATFLLQRSSDCRRIGTVCSGLYGLASTGLLDDREVTINWRFATDAARCFPRLRINHKRPLVQSGPFYTSSGLAAGVNLSLAMIREDYGPFVAQAVESELFRDQTNLEGKESEGGPLDRRPNERFADLIPWIVRNLQGDLSVEILARRACMSPNHFSKAFKSVFGQPPKLFIENLRLNEARRRLSKRQKTIFGVAASVGFTDPAAFQRAYQRRFGARPGANFATTAEER